MKQLDLATLLAVFNEMLGPLLWVLAALIVLGTLAFASLLVRERGLVTKRLVWSQLAGIIGGFMALVLMAQVSSSGFTDAAGPADWILIVMVFVAGMVGSTILIYTITGWRRTVSRSHA